MPGGVPRRERKKRKEIRKEELQRLEHKSARIYVGVMRIDLFTLKKKKEKNVHFGRKRSLIIGIQGRNQGS